MSKLGNLIGAPKKVVIKDIELELVPLKVKDMMAFGNKDVEKMSTEEQMAMNREMIKKSISGEQVTDEEIDNLNVEVYTSLLNEVMELNGFGENGPNNGIKGKIEQLRAKQGSNNSS